jgi:hypothetical protein
VPDDLARQFDRHADRLRELALTIASGQLGGSDAATTELLHWHGVLDLVMGACPEPVATLFLREGEYWTIGRRRHFRLRHSKGLAYLAQLLARPGRELHALDLLCRGRIADGLGLGRSFGEGEEPCELEGSTVDVRLDAVARASYRSRLAELRTAVEEATATGDLGTAAAAREELEWIGRELAHAFGIGQRARGLPSPAERARQSVTKAIRVAIDRIGSEDADIARHLDRTVRTGTYCSYDPDPGAQLRWQV